MTQTTFRRACATVAICLLGGVAFAAGPAFWQTATESDLLKGEIENLTVDPFGRLTLGPTTTPVYDTGTPFLWTMLQGADGATYVGSGNEGQVYRIEANGTGRVFFDADELEVHALAAAPGGGLYVATSPDGRIYKVDAAGRGTAFFDPPDRYIWSLAVDRQGAVYAGTGDKGQVYRITPDGRGAAFYQTKASHAMSLAFDREGRLLVGTDSPARVFQVDASGRGFLLLDSGYNEIHTLRVDGSGTIYAAAIGGRPSLATTPPPAAAEPASATPQPVVTVTTEVTFVGVADTGTAASTPAQPARPSTTTGAIYRIGADGASDVIWESREDSPYDMVVEGPASLLVATGNKGKIYRLSGERLQPTLVARTSVQQVTALVRDRSGQVLFATSNPGRVLRLGATTATTGTYTSDIRDAGTVAAWGTIRWQGLVAAGAKVEVATRSGNSRTPDDTWSDWSAPYTDAAGSPIRSPRARYLQWRAVLTAGRGEAPVVTSVTAAYLPRNIRPKVTSITINPPGTIYQRPFPTDPDIQGFDGDAPDRRFAAQTAGTTAGATPSLGRRAYQKGLLTFVWRAEDDNRDDLAYDVEYRREGDTAWKNLKKGLTEAILVWDTTSVPNGRYILRVVASDGPSNAPPAALTGSLESATFDIDNTAPAIVVTGARRDGARTILAFDVRDDDSTVLRVEYSLDSEKWETVYPKDGIADSRVEQFELTLEGDAATRGVVIRATDAQNNLGTGRGEVPPAPPARR